MPRNSLLEAAPFANTSAAFKEPTNNDNAKRNSASLPFYRSSIQILEDNSNQCVSHTRSSSDTEVLNDKQHVHKAQNMVNINSRDRSFTLAGFQDEIIWDEWHVDDVVRRDVFFVKHDSLIF